MKSLTASITMLSLPFLLLSVFCFRFSFQLSGKLPRNCTRKCGNVTIHFPFGIEPNCYLPNFKVICNNSGPYLEIVDLPIESIDLPEKVTLLTTGKMAVDKQNASRSTVFSPKFSSTNEAENASFIELKFPFTFSGRWTKFVAMGCDTRANINGSFFSSACECQWMRGEDGGVHGGLGRCHISIPDGQKRFNYNVTNFFDYTQSACVGKYSFAVLVEMGYSFNESNLLEYTVNGSNGIRKSLPLAADWGVVGPNYCGPNTWNDTSRNGNGTVCRCNDDRKGNPYLGGDEGCQPPPRDKGLIFALAGIGVGVSIIGASYTYETFVEKKLALIRQARFIQNGGEILQDIISQSPASSGTGASIPPDPGSTAFADTSVTPVTAADENSTIFTQENLVKAIKLLRKGYDVAVNIKQWRRSTGILPNRTKIDIRPFKMEDRGENDQFMKEFVKLKGFKHPYMATLVGCCLETPDPSLVYEFVAENTLYDHLHSSPAQKTPLSWSYRLMIAKGVAHALAEAHALRILHRDVRSANVLLDEKYNPKVVEFGVTRFLSTASYVSRTVGYLDPEYAYTNLLTEKSDVYSFGVVLVELISGQDPTSRQGKEKGTSLAMHFISEMKQNRLEFIAEPDILNEAGMDVLNEVAELAQRCLQLNGKERPAMNEVAAKLSLIGDEEEKPGEVPGESGKEDNGRDRIDKIVEFLGEEDIKQTLSDLGAF